VNAPNDKLAEIESYLPGMKSPTVMPLAEEGWEFGTFSKSKKNIFGKSSAN